MNSITKCPFMSLSTNVLCAVVVPYLSPLETEILSAVSSKIRLDICTNEDLWKKKVIYQLGLEEVEKYYSLKEKRYGKSWYKLSIALRITAVVFTSDGILERGEFRASKLHGWGEREASKIQEKGLFQSGCLIKGVRVRRSSKISEEGSVEEGQFSGLGKRSRFDEENRLWYKEEGTFFKGTSHGFWIRRYSDGRVREVEYAHGEYKGRRVILPAAARGCQIL